MRYSIFNRSNGTNWSWRFFFVVGVGGILLIALILAVYQILVLPRGKGFDFFTIWFGIREIWQRRDPYSQATTRAIQREMFGEILSSDENQQGFAYPLYVAWILGPFALLSFPAAVTIWCTMQFVFLMIFPYITMRAFRWSPSQMDILTWATVVLLIFRYPLIAFMLGQTTILVLLGSAFGLYWLVRKNDLLSGAVFTLTVVKPNLSTFIVGSVLLWAILARRWKVVGGMGGMITFLIGSSFAWDPAWLENFISGVQSYTSYSNILWPFQQIEPLWLGKMMLFILALLTSLAIINAIKQKSRSSILFAFCFIIVFSLVALPQTGSYSLTLLLLPAIGFVAMAPNDPVVRVGTLMSLVSPWFYWWLERRQGIQIDQIALPFQFALIGAWILFSNTNWIVSLLAVVEE